MSFAKFCTFEELHESLRQARKSAGYSQTDVPGLTNATISKLESGSDVNLATIKKYIDGLGLKVFFVIGMDGPAMQRLLDYNKDSA